MTTNIAHLNEKERQRYLEKTLIIGRDPYLLPSTLFCHLTSAPTVIYWRIQQTNNNKHLSWYAIHPHTPEIAWRLSRLQMHINMQLQNGWTTPRNGIWRKTICMSSQDILVIQTAIINQFILVVVKSANVGQLGVAKAFSEGLNSSLTISTLACSG